MSELYDEIKEQVDALIIEFQAELEDGFQLGDIWRLAAEVSRRLVLIVEAMGGEAGEDKKAAVLEAVDLFYATVIAPLDLPYVPNFLERRVGDPLLGKLFHALASAAIDAIVGNYNATGWPTPA